MKHLRLFEEWNKERFASKEEQRDYYRNKAGEVPIEERIYTTDQLGKFGIPDEIIERMKDWDVIVKSPYGLSFYSSKEVSWANKPDISFRVSDHWNFEARGSVHCKTDIPVKNTSHISLGQYDKSSNKYKILLSLPSADFIHKQELGKRKVDYMRSPEVIEKKREFKKRVENKEIHCEFKGIKGIVRKYTGNVLKIEDETGELIYTNDDLENKNSSIKLFDKEGNSIVNPFDVKFESLKYLF